MKIILLTFLVVIYCSTANVILRYSTSANEPHPKDAHVIDHGISESQSPDRQLSRRAGRSKCRAPKRGSGIAKRSPVASFDNATIHRRMRLPTLDTIDDYIVEETEEAESVVWGQRDTNEDKTEFDTNTSVFDEFKFYTDREMSQGAMHLTGCTMLVIVSRRGVWIGHFWENVSFATDEDHYFWDKYKENQDRIFFESVIKGMRNGKGSGARKQQDSLRLAAVKFDDDHLKAYLIHPTTNWKQDGDYRVYWDQMKAEALLHLPKLGQPGRWEEHSYDPVDDDDILDETPHGRLLFKYDPNHRSIGPQIAPGGVPITEHLAMLWSETRELHNDAWPADTT